MIASSVAYPATLEDRATVLAICRRAPEERVDRVRRDGLRDLCDPLRHRITGWVAERRASAPGRPLPAMRARCIWAGHAVVAKINQHDYRVGFAA